MNRLAVRLRALLMGLVSCGVQAASASSLAPGTHEIRVAVSSGSTVVVRAQVGRPLAEHCASWGWGAESVCPETAVQAVHVRVGTQEIYVPRSAYLDLGSPRSVSVSPDRSGFVVVVRGGDAATSYTARLRFTNTVIRSRRVHSGEFSGTAWEETRYSFTD